MKIPRKKRVKSSDFVKSISDDYGNLVVCKNNGKRIIITLKLVNEQRHRRIGIVNLSEKILYIRRSRDKHLFRKFESYGFNYKLLYDSKLFDKVSLTDEFSRYTIPKKFIIDNGKFLHFKRNGFELQTFLTLQEIEQFRKPNII